MITGRSFFRLLEVQCRSHRPVHCPIFVFAGLRERDACVELAGGIPARRVSVSTAPGCPTSACTASRTGRIPAISSE